MTREEYKNRLAEISVAVHAGVVDYNSAFAENRFADASAIAAAIDKNIDEYNSITQMLCFDECAKSDDPMRSACLLLHYPVIDVKDVIVDKESKATKRVVIGDPADEDYVPKYRQIDLLKLDKYVTDRGGSGIGVDTKWKYMAEGLNLLFALDCAVEIGKGQEFINEMRDCYAIREASRGIDFGVKDPKAGTPISNTGLLKAVRAVVTAMIGEEDGAKVLSHDVRFLKFATAKKSRKELTLQCSNHKYMRGYLMEICHRVITGGVYEVDFKRAKGK